MQRIFYEVYRDRAAFDRHDRQPYMQRFVAERRSCVLATNVIELRLKYAKVSPLPQSQAPAAAQARPQLPAPPQSSQPLKPQGPQPQGPQPQFPQPQPQAPKPQPQSPPQQMPAPGRRYGGS
jgi:hypothetical protein